MVAFAHSALRFSIPAFAPRSMPFESEAWYVLGFTENVTLSGDLPLFVRILTMPLPRSPYSAEGTPDITSTDSTLSTAILRVSTPVISPKPALLPIRTPSTSTAVENAALPAAVPPERTEKLDAAVRSGLEVLPPGSSAAMSVILLSCRWSRALRPMSWEVPIPSFGLCAVTTTSWSARLLSFILISKLSMSRETVIVRE